MAAKLGIAAIATLLLIPLLIATAAKGALSSVFGGSSQPSSTALADIPTDYLALYRHAATVCPGLDWSILAAIGKVESDHGRSPLPGVVSGENHAGAAGPMQFLKPTFNSVIANHDIPPGGADPPSRYSPHDAIHAAAYYLCDNGAGQGKLRAAIFAYNHSRQYVDAVLAQAEHYAEAATGTGNCQHIRAPNPAAATAINYACGQLGLPYVWGGDGPAAGDAGFDCSGLTKAAYAAAGITLPRTAHAQFRSGPRVPAGQPLLPGDLVFYGTSTHIHHVGIYIGSGRMINAPTFNTPIRIDEYRWPGDDYFAATRPAANKRAVRNVHR